MINTYTDEDFHALQVLVRQLQGRFRWGVGSPEGVVDAPMGAIWEDTTPTTGGALYRKTSDLGTTTGWVSP